MKSKNVLLMVAAMALGLVAGCGGKTDEPAAVPKGAADQAMGAGGGATSQDLADAAKAAAQQAAQTAEKVVTSAQSTIAAQKPAVDQAAQSASAAAADTSSQAQTIIEKAKGLVTDQKYQDAFATLQQLSNLKLTPEQQKLFDGLKAQIQAALAKKTATDAASSLGNALGGKK